VILEEICNDGIDNDGDGLVDIDDPDCQSPEICDDLIDNDGDGFIDGADPDCQIAPPEDVIGGEIIPLDTTSLILAGAQTFSWMIPVVLSVLGIGLFVFRKSENS